jgi:hypothetical protein
VESRRSIEIFAVTGLAVIACGSFAAAPDRAEDAGTEDAAGPAPPIARRCEGREHLFDEFNRATATPGNGWGAAADALVEIRNAGATPPALYSETPFFPTGQGDDNTLGRQFVLGTDTRACIEVDAIVELGEGAFTADSFAEILSVHPATGANIFVEMRAAGFSLVRTTDPIVAASFVPAKWQHFVLKLTYGPSAQPSLQIDDTPPVTHPNESAVVPATLEVRLGIQANARTGTAPGVRAHFDNFRFTSQP